MRSYFGPLEFTTQTASRSVKPFFARLTIVANRQTDRQTDGQTDHATPGTPFVAIGRICT